MEYGKRLKGHLAGYKRSVLLVKEDGIWSKNGKPYAHILPKPLQDLNLDEMIRGECLVYMAQRGIKRHRDFHHLNSSQAFTFNLFFPFLTGADEDRAALLRALDLRGQVRDWEFEAVPEEAEGTNVDLWLDLAPTGQVFIEVKLTETSFGSAKPNKQRREKLQQIYRDRLAGKVSASAMKEPAFFANYQLLRNFSHVGRKAEVVLLLVLPSANRHARSQAESFVNEVVLDAYKSSVRLVFIEDLVGRLDDDPQLSSKAKAALARIKQKYAV